MSTRGVILVGGYGTRLGTLLGEIPKPMAPIGGRPFLEYLLYPLRRAGIRNVTLCCGYRAEVIERYFGIGADWDLEIVYSMETTPLGTGGALRKARASMREETLVVMNGDSYFAISISELIRVHRD